MVRETPYVMPHGTSGTFPWDVGSAEPGALATLAHSYALECYETLLPEELSLEARLSESGKISCAHLAENSSEKVITREKVHRCETCQSLVHESENREELELSVALAHWNAWLVLQPTGSAAAILSSIHEFATSVSKYLPRKARKRIHTLTRIARQNLKNTPPVFEPERWALAGKYEGALEDSLAWAYAVTSGANPAQAEAYCKWVDTYPGDSHAVPLEDESYLLWSPKSTSFQNDWVEPSLSARAKAALRPHPRGGMWAVPSDTAAAMRNLTRGYALPGFSILEPKVLDCPPNAAKAEVAELATKLWTKAPENKKLRSAYDALEAATARHRWPPVLIAPVWPSWVR